MSDGKKPEATQMRLVGADFVHSFRFIEERTSLHIGVDKQTSTCDSLTPARLEPDGTPVAIKAGERADGILFRKRAHDRIRNVYYLAQAFSPWANIRGLVYAEPTPENR